MLGRDDLGRLAPGSKADIAIVDLSALRTGPIEDPIRTMVLNANGAHVKTVIVDGRTVVEDGAVPGVDTEGLPVWDLVAALYAAGRLPSARFAGEQMVDFDPLAAREAFFDLLETPLSPPGRGGWG